MGSLAEIGGIGSCCGFLFWTPSSKFCPTKNNIEVRSRDKVLELDKHLQKIAKRKLSKLKFKLCDVLIIDEIGIQFRVDPTSKNIQGLTPSNERAFFDAVEGMGQ